MAIHIYNSLTRKKDLPFEPLKPPQVNIYTCGVTVYDDCHIGHARSLYIFDVMRRYLEYKKYKVNFVRNITDIDDKIINRARLENKGEPLIDTVKSVTDKYIKSYYEDLESLGIPRATFEPRATENIPEMVEYIKLLVDKGYAYVTNTGVYFSVRKFKNYGKLSGQTIDQMLTGVRKESDETKDDPLDFALWKLSKPDEPKWPSPWGEGRPGWHIECSVMSQKFLKTDTLDIHAGGLDLIFPHHENEIAQAEALTGKPFAKYWIHHGLLTINGHKMSKSLGNFITIKDALNKYSPDGLKLFFLSAHYGSPIDFTHDKMKEAHKRILNFQNLLAKSLRIVRPVGINSSAKQPEFIDRHINSFLEAMDDDFNTPRALGSIDNLIHDTHKFIDSDSNNADYVNIIHMASEIIIELCKDVFGLENITYWEQLSKEENNLLEERNKAKANKNFKRSDELREELRNKGIIVEDTKEGQTWRRA